MRRALVITDESCRNRFRASLPPHVRGNRVAAPAAVLSWRQALTLTAEDARGFATSYIACFVAVAAFIF